MPLVRLAFKILIIVIIYFIIFWSLKIMYRDIKGGNKKKKHGKRLGLEIMKLGEDNSILKLGSVIPIHSKLTIGRNDDNQLVLKDPYVSGHHAVIFLKNNDYVIEDLKSTNGTLLNNAKLEKQSYLNIDDEIAIGEYVFKIIG
ncbi:FHA domain-containing protein FhaB [Clostridium homopropionicum DSM 5847]|uniref:FHA domain-containing protein FhaB n=1 Tax=Clostridium homopropionicum DSM 5847 TaxID=1121318 RepID=A0A0L6Z9Y5_9CLOT|nr:FHA domain-containing protein [Clostridium homopropionicum]KOA19608.1 FHA domain-containing protein FhaB [Clostridium homopropionicum DSM 5847]SFF81861.1 FHA domain-containing protein [Clostridium homopropionicum]